MAARDQIDRLADQWQAEQPGIDSETMATVARLLRVASLIEQRLEGFAAEHGLRRADGDLLFTLRRAGAPFRLAPSQLGAALLVSSGTMTARLDRLESRGLIRRVPNPQDRRGTDVELTAEGRVLVDEAIVEHVAREQRMLEPLSDRERGQLQALTRKLLAHLSDG